MQKRGQITVFIIIGTIMLASVMLFFYFKSTMSERMGTSSSQSSQQSMPVKSFVEDCIKTVARDGVTTLGLNGGYINFPARIAANPLTYLSTGPLGIHPYWWYDGVDGIPSEETLKQQISEHVTRELKACLNDFEAFSDVYEVNEKGNIVTKTELTDQSVIIDVSYPLDVQSVTNRTRIDLVQYRATLPIRLKKTYGLAKAIMEMENHDGFIEQRTIDLMVLAGEETIPLSHFEVSCNKREWYLSQIKPYLKELLRRNFQFIKITGTDYTDQSYVPIPSEFSTRQTFNESYFNYHYIWDVANDAPADMRVAIIYDEAWPLDIYARPSKNGILKSNAQEGMDIMKHFCLHLWHFTYDISFPVMVSIDDPRTSEHEEFSFMFAFKANIDHNEPARENIAKQMIQPADRATNDIFCNDLLNEVTIYTEDKVTGESIDEVNLTFICGPFECPVGITEWFSSEGIYGSSAGITGLLPSCSQGLIKGAREGYEESKDWAQTDIPGKSFTLKMTPVISINDITVVAHNFQNDIVDPVEKPLDSGEQATVTITRIGGDEFDSFTGYPSQNIPLKMLDKEDITYELAIYLIKDNVITGGYKQDWIVNAADLEGLTKIKFHALKIKTSDDIERYAFIDGLSTYSADAPLPELIWS